MIFWQQNNLLRILDFLMKGFQVYNLLFEILSNIGICFYN